MAITTAMNWKEYQAYFQCFPVVGEYIKDNDGQIYKVVEVRKGSIVLELQR